MTQEEFAHSLQVAGSSIGNWESGRKRPAPKYLRKMAGLAPAFAREIDVELRNYEWHRKAAPASAPDELHELPPDIGKEIQRLAGKHELDTSVIILQALRTGLAALSRDSSPDWKTLVKRQADIARKVHDREHPAEPGRKHPRSKIA
ncbi:MAG: helix-turn-helix transcriptional regulator [Acidobacteriia bacterium]|nr:helix-turn-helix transcriptional regulator [Terriglobia bacterium]